MNTNPNQTNSENSQGLGDSLAKLPKRRFLTTLGAAAGGALLGGNAFGKSPVELIKLEGKVVFPPGEVSPFDLQGVASHLGRFTAYGEIEFVPGVREGTLVGDGVGVFTAANGDLLVGVVSWDIDPGVEDRRNSQIRVSWRDSVEFKDGRVIFSTGRFTDNGPPGFIISLEMLFVAVVLIIGIIVPYSARR